MAGYSIDEMCAMEFTELVKVLQTIDDPRVATIVDALTASLTRMIDIGLPYLSMDRESSTLSGGEAQRLRLVRYMGSSLTGMTYIFDEPSTGMHPRDVYGFLTVCSMMAWCLGYFGMPQVLLRFMAIRKEEEPNRSRRIANDSVHCSPSPRTLRRLRIITNEYRAAAASYFC